MCVRTEARLMVAALAGPREWNDTRESWLARAARSIGLSHARTRNIFYYRARTITAEEWILLTQRIDALKAAQRRHEGESDELRALLRNQRETRIVAGRDTERLGAKAARVRD